MHLVVSWDITDGPDRSEISQQMVLVLQPYSWVRPLTTFYIVKANPLERDAIITGLNNVEHAHPGRVRFVVSPLMQGPYQGLLTKDDWDKINERTDND